MAKTKLEDPEKFAEIVRKGANSAARMAKPRTPKGIPYRSTNIEWAVQRDDARKLAHRIYKIMDVEGSLPENPIARKAMKTALEMLAEDNSTRDKLSIVRTLLEYSQAKPAQTQNVNVRTAEDFLDDLANEDG